MTEIEIISERILELQRKLATLQNQLQTLHRARSMLLFERIINKGQTTQ